MPPKVTAGLARSRVSGYSRSPAPPASSTPNVSFMPRRSRSRNLLMLAEGNASRAAAEILLVDQFRSFDFVIPSEARDLLFVGSAANANEQQIPRSARDDEN